MGVKAVYASADDVPEELKEFYTEGDDGQMILDVEDVDSHPTVRGVVTANKENKSKRDALRRENEELRAKVENLPEDFDADEWERLKSGKSGDEAIEQLKEQHARAVEKLKTQHSEELAKANEQLQERDGYIDRTTRLDHLRKALREAGVDPTHEDLITDHLSPKIKVTREDDGSRRPFVETDLGEKAVDEFVAEWAKTKGKPYLKPVSGPDAQGGNKRSGSKTMTREQFEQLDPTARAEAMAAKVELVD